MPARRNMGRIDVCCQSNRLTILQSEPGDHDTKMLFGWRSGWRMQKRLKAGFLGTSDDVIPRYRSKFSTWSDGDCCWYL
jgi:hypothetical protein